MSGFIMIFQNKKIYWLIISLIALIIPVSVLAVDSTERTDKSAIRGTISSGNFGDITYDWATNNDEFEVYDPPPAGPAPLPADKTEAYVNLSDRLIGYSWSSNVGWINLNAYNNLSIKPLPAYMLSPNPRPAILPVGINLDDVRLITGQAWGDNFGEIIFPEPASVADLWYTSNYYLLLDLEGGVTYGRGWSANIGEIDMNGILIDIVPTDPINPPSPPPTSGIYILGNNEIFAADNQKKLDINYQLSGGSQIKEVRIDIELSSNPAGIVSYYKYRDGTGDSNVTISGSVISFEHDFSVVDLYEDSRGVREFSFTMEIIDRAGNKTTKDFMVQVVAGELDKGSASSFSFDTTPKIADGVDLYTITDLSLRDVYNNPIISVSGIKTAEIELDISNNVDLIQSNPVAGYPSFEIDDGAAVCLDAPQFVSESCGGEYLNPHIIDDSSAIKGDYSGLNIRSYAPTYNRYPLTNPNNSLAISRLQLIVTPLVVASVGEGNFDILPADFGIASFDLSFDPVFTNELQGPTGIGDFPQQFSEGVQGNFNMYTKNEGGNIEIRQIDIAEVCVLDDAVFDCYLKDGDPAIIDEGLGSYALLGDNLVTHYSGAIIPVDKEVHVGSDYSVLTFNNDDLREQLLTPLSLLGMISSTGGTTTELDLHSIIAYTHPDGTIIVYPGHNQQNLQVLARDIHIEGRLSSAVVGGVAAQSLGSLSKAEVVQSVYKEVASITRNAQVVGGGQTTPLTSWDSAVDTHGLLDGQVLYYENDDVRLGDLVISGRKTIIVRGGDLFIEGDIIYDLSDPNTALGIIVLNDDNTNRNIYIKDTVNYIHAVLYTDGSILSWTGVGKTHYDGTNTFTGDLKNQLYISGVVISSNSVGGSRKNPPELPVGVMVSDFVGADNIRKAKLSQGYDLKYLRQYSPDNPLAMAANDLVNGTTNSSSVVIEYDKGIINSNRVPLGFAGALTVSSQESRQ